MISKSTGDFEGIVRKIWKEEKGIDIPGDMPDVEDNVSDSDSENGDHDEGEEAYGAGKSNSEVVVVDLPDITGMVDKDSEKSIMDKEHDKDKKIPQEEEEIANDNGTKKEEVVSNERDAVFDDQKGGQETRDADTGAKELDENVPDALESSTTVDEDNAGNNKAHKTDDQQVLETIKKNEADLDSRSRRKRSRSNSISRSTKKQKGETAKNEIIDDKKPDVQMGDSAPGSRLAPSNDNRNRDNPRASNRSSHHHPQPHHGGNLRGPQYPPSGMRRSPPPNSGHGPTPQRGHAGPGNFRGPPGSHGGPRGRDDRGPRGGGRGDMERDRRGGGGPRNSRR